jgi:threonine dehydratase
VTARAVLPLTPVPLEEIEQARERLCGVAVRTPLVRLAGDDAPGEIWLKLENLQPIGSFKIRGAGNAIAHRSAESLRDGVWTASAGNMAQGVAWCARERGIPCRVVVPDHAPATKIAAIERLGGEVIRLPFDEWWGIMMTHRAEGVPGAFVHPVADRNVIAGNGTIGLEILEDLPGVDTIVVPFGGGGLSTGIACAVRGRGSNARVLAAEVETAAPLSASFAAGRAVRIDRTPTFVDGIGGQSVLEEMWPLVREVLAGAIVVSLDEIMRAIRLLLERNRVLAEGAGGASVAAALSGRAGHGRIVCVISGGNIDLSRLAKILNGETP